MTRMLQLERPVFHYYMDDLYTDLRGITRQVALTDRPVMLEQLAEEPLAKLEDYLILVYDGLIGQRYGNGILYGTQ